MEYPPIDPKTYGVSIPPPAPRRENPNHENHEQVKPASNQTARPPPDLAHGSEPGNTGKDSDDRTHGARSSPQETAPDPTPTAPPQSRPKRARQSSTSQRQGAKKHWWRQWLARRLGREEDTISSDDEREYWEALEQRLAAEDARRDALSPEERREEDIQQEARAFKEHIKPQFAPDWANSVKILSHYPVFVLQTAPHSNNGAKCRIDSCTVTIKPDYYHVKCFEELLDLSSPHYLARFESDITKYIPDIGAQYILEEYLRRWKVRIGLLRDDERAASDPASNPLDSERAPSNTTPGVEATITSQSGNSSQYKAMDDIPPTNQPAGNEGEDEWRRADEVWAEKREHRILRLQVDPDILRASLGKDDSAVEWDITDYVVQKDNPDHDKRHLLSAALSDWDIVRRIATTDIERLNDVGLKFHDLLGKETIEKIKRYAAV